MLYIENFQFPNEERRVYPYHLLSKKGLEHIEFAPITILYGNNGSGKSTILNMIAERLAIRDVTLGNTNEYFSSCVRKCTSLSTMQFCDSLSQLLRILNYTDMRTIEEQHKLLEELLSQARQRMNAGETEWIEFKTNIGESRCSITYEGVGNYISGLSNSACLKYKSHGYLILGVEDSTWNVVGTNLQMPTAKYGNQDYELWLRRNCSPIIPFGIEEFEYQGKHIVIFEIQAAVGEPVNFKGAAYVRVGSNLTKLKDFPDFVRQIYNSQKDWSAEIVEGATIDDLAPDAIKKARELYGKKHEDLKEEMSLWDDVKFLNKAKIMLKGKITNTAILLLGRSESEYLIFQQLLASAGFTRIQLVTKGTSLLRLAHL